MLNLVQSSSWVLLLVLPDILDEEQAFALMLNDPILIRRPLMEIGSHRLVGFEPEKINQILALSWDESKTGSLERCPRYIGESCAESEE